MSSAMAGEAEPDPSFSASLIQPVRLFAYKGGIEQRQEDLFQYYVSERLAWDAVYIAPLDFYIIISCKCF